MIGCGAVVGGLRLMRWTVHDISVALTKGETTGRTISASLEYLKYAFGSFCRPPRPLCCLLPYMSETVSVSNNVHSFREQSLIYLATLLLLYMTVYLERCEQHLRIAHVKLRRDALHLLERWITCMADGLQSDTRVLCNGGVDGRICYRRCHSSYRSTSAAVSHIAPLESVRGD